MKRAFWKWLLWAMAVLAALLLAGSALAESGTCGDNVTWTLEDGVLTISGTGETKDYWTNSPFYNNADIREVVIESGVTRIGNGLFRECTGLTGVSIPDTVQSMGTYVFYKCSALETLAIPEGVTEIGSFACNECASLTGISLPSTIENIASYAFWNCSSLTGTLTLPANLSTIGQGAFYKTGYDTLVFSAGVTEIGKSSFSNCKSLTELRFPGAMSGNCVIGETAFNACSALVSVTLPEGVTALEVSSFQLCRGLTSIALPGSLRTIDALAFGWCDSLTEIIVPEGVSTIGRRAFSGCKSLVHATFPASVQSIGGLAFINCQSVKLYILGANTTIDSETLNGEEVTDFFNPNNAFYGAVYCIQGSPADALASEKGYTVRYIDPETGLESVREVETEYAHLWLPLGATRQMGASLYPPVEGAVFAFTSCQPDIVSVEASQEDPSVVNLTGLAPGVARVTITSPDSSIVTEVTVDVYRPVDDFAISAAAWMFPGDSAQLTVVNVLPDGAEGDFFWWSSDDSVATVTKNGVVSGHNPGEATITAQNGEMARTTTVHVNAPLDYLRFDFEAIVLKQGRATQLFSDLPWLEEHSVNRLVVFSSADESVAAVDQLGWVTAVGRGITTIRVQDYNDPTVYVDCAAVVLSPNPQKLLLPGNLNAIEAEAFYGVAGAEIAVIPDSCGSIGGNAFTGCDSLLLVSLPKDISIAGSAFDDDGQWAFVCPPGGTAAAYAAQKGRMCFESVIWISDEDSVLAE